MKTVFKSDDSNMATFGILLKWLQEFGNTSIITKFKESAGIVNLSEPVRSYLMPLGHFFFYNRFNDCKEPGDIWFQRVSITNHTTRSILIYCIRNCQKE